MTDGRRSMERVRDFSPYELKVIESGGLLHDAVRDLLGQARPEFRQLRPEGACGLRGQEEGELASLAADVHRHVGCGHVRLTHLLRILDPFPHAFTGQARGQ